MLYSSRHTNINDDDDDEETSPAGSPNKVNVDETESRMAPIDDIEPPQAMAATADIDSLRIFINLIYFVYCLFCSYIEQCYY